MSVRHWSWYLTVFLLMFKIQCVILKKSVRYAYEATICVDYGCRISQNATFCLEGGGWFCEKLLTMAIKGPIIVTGPSIHCVGLIVYKHY